jgi:hypothetical protein
MKDILRPLRFSGDYLDNIYSDYLYDKTNNSLKVDRQFVEYYFKVSVDDEIKAPPEPGKLYIPLPGNNFDVCED